jgi:transcriptional repressor NrdR
MFEGRVFFVKCPFCSYEDTKVIDSRSQEDNSVIRRRRLCEKCGKRFTTYERIDTIPLTVIKKDNTREQFDKTKLLNGIMKSCYKRPVSLHQMELLVENIENAITNSERKEIESQKIGDMVIEELKNLDEVSYVRFASVYRQFKDINTFREALEKIVNEKTTL